ncbi:MAG TPA: SPFH domain-containing protein [Acidimicrobiales bacterium]|jgi:regulator of protease activity HflC (stomatin/prohibitin superfamily)|nr:SPFH domain-containing protein [Acidimicrobiales bacterium]
MAIINFVKDYERLARFKFGRFQGMKGPGPVVAVPIVHHIRKLDTRTVVIDIPQQTNITKDNASISIDFLVFMRIDINEAEKAVMEVEDHRIAVSGLATTTLRAVVGDINLDDVLSQRERINEAIRERLDAETTRWGIRVTNVEIREIVPPREILEAMNRQMSAERLRRAAILEAEGDRQGAILRAEGAKQSEILKAQGDQQAAVLRAEGFATALQRIYDVAHTVDPNTMRLQYLDALKSLGQGPATKFVFPMEFTDLVGTLAAAREPNGSQGDDER